MDTKQPELRFVPRELIAAAAAVALILFGSSLTLGLIEVAVSPEFVRLTDQVQAVFFLLAITAFGAAVTGTWFLMAFIIVFNLVSSVRRQQFRSKLFDLSGAFVIATAMAVALVLFGGD